ncbi:MAG TPA: ankyrin repeat domain-containing protein [Bryobacteraceae bacterium]
MSRLVTAALISVATLSGLQAANSVSDRFYEAIRTDDAAAVNLLLTRGASVNTRDDRGATPLMYAAAVGSTRMMQQLVAAGADVNAKNTFDATALMWCTNQFDKVKLLTDSGADVNARSNRGRTVLLVAASHDSNARVIRLLLSKGADPLTAADKTNNTPLLASAYANDTESIKIFLEKGADVNARNIAGLNALMFAASHGNVEIVRALLARGANVNEQSGPTIAPPVRHGLIAVGKLSPLMLAVTSGSAETVRLLLQAGADVNAKDVRGMTPLMLAIATDHPNDVIVGMLLAKGPAMDAKSNANETALAWSAKFKYPPLVAAIGEMSAESAAPALTSVSGTHANVNNAQIASERGISLLQRASGTFFKNSGCVSCHAQNISIVAASTARRQGIRFDAPAQAEMVRSLRLHFAALAGGMLERMDPPAVDILTYALYALYAEGAAPDRTTDAMVHNLAAQQQADGSWGRGSFGIRRPPLADSGFSPTAIAIRVLKQYAPPARKAEMEERIARASNWLLTAEPRTTEDYVMQLLGAKSAAASQTVVARLTHNLLNLQREDGGWAQTPYLKSDAYATGTALYALNQASGLNDAHPAYRRGTQFLLTSQASDGSWYVASRAPKFQPYFEGGFPYGHDQWISEMATGWAGIALALATPETRASR